MTRFAEPISQRKFDANRRNAAKSTGPRSEQGKKTVSRNALRHGMFSQHVVLPGEDVEAFDQLRRDTVRKFNPRDPVELRLVEQAISAMWKLQRLEGVELQLCKSKADEMNQQITAKLVGCIESTRDVIESTRQDIKKHGPNGFQEECACYERRLEQAERELAAVKPVTGAQALAVLFQSSDPALQHVHRHMQKLENSLHRAMRQLRELQKAPAEPEPCEFTAELLESEQPEEATAESERENDGTNPPLAEIPAGPELAPPEQPAVVDDSSSDQNLESGGDPHNLCEYPIPKERAA
jgi:hypothetical protein